jgi:DNA-binding MarR family transcriptional regulator
MTIRATVPTEQITDRTMYRLHRARVATAEAVNATLSDLKLNGTLTLVLEALDELGEASAAEIARRCLVTRQALTGPLNELQNRGLVQRPESSANVRTRPVALTALGREVSADVRGRIARLEHDAAAGLTSDELAALRDLLTRYAAGWERIAEASANPRTAGL